MHSSGKTLKQCTMATNKQNANQISGTIKKWKDEDIIIKLYKALARPKLEHYTQSWCTQLKINQEVLEKVQAKCLGKGFQPQDCK